MLFRIEPGEVLERQARGRRCVSLLDDETAQVGVSLQHRAHECLAEGTGAARDENRTMGKRHCCRAVSGLSALRPMAMYSRPAPVGRCES